MVLKEIQRKGVYLDKRCLKDKTENAGRWLVFSVEL